FVNAVLSFYLGDTTIGQEAHSAGCALADWCYWQTDIPSIYEAQNPRSNRLYRSAFGAAGLLRRHLQLCRHPNELRVDGVGKNARDDAHASYSSLYCPRTKPRRL